MGIVLGEEPLIGLRAGAVGDRVAPAVEEVASFAALSTGVGGGLGGCRAVVDDPELTERADADHDLIELGVVGNRVAVGPVGDDPAVAPRRRVADVADALEPVHVPLLLGLVLLRGVLPGEVTARRAWRTAAGKAHVAVAEVDVDQFGVLAHVAEVRLRGVSVLDQVVPGVPFPDDLAGGLAGGLDFNDRVSQPRPTHGIGPTAGGDCLGAGLDLPDDQQDVAVREPADGVVGDALVIMELEVPDEAAVPVELLNPPPLTRAAKEPLAVVECGGAEEMAVLEKVRLLAGGVLALPGANDPPLHVDQVTLLRVQRRHQGVALKRPGIAVLQAELGRSGFLPRRALACFVAATSSGAAKAAMATFARVRTADAKTTATRWQIRSGRNPMAVTPPGKEIKGC